MKEMSFFVQEGLQVSGLFVLFALDLVCGWLKRFVRMLNQDFKDSSTKFGFQKLGLREIQS